MGEPRTPSRFFHSTEHNFHTSGSRSPMEPSPTNFASEQMEVAATTWWRGRARRCGVTSWRVDTNLRYNRHLLLLYGIRRGDFAGLEISFQPRTIHVTRPAADGTGDGVFCWSQASSPGPGTGRF